jgi:hypothetical protein
MAVHRIAIAPLIVTALWLMSGCGGSSQGPYAISGSVNVDGAPLEKGNISFQPTQQQPTSSGAVVSGGKFTVPRESGLMVGNYRVVVNAAVPGTGGQVNPEALPGDPPAPPKEMIPPDWNVASKQSIDVKSEGPFAFDFEISTKAKGK